MTFPWVLGVWGAQGCVWGLVKPPLSRGGAEEGPSWGGPSACGWVGLAHVPLGPQDYCGQNTSLGSFSIFTENVPCGTTGVTCSKAIKIFIGVSAAHPPGGCMVLGGPSDQASDGPSPLGTEDGAEAGGQALRGDPA